MWSVYHIICSAIVNKNNHSFRSAQVHQNQEKETAENTMVSQLAKDTHNYNH